MRRITGITSITSNLQKLKLPTSKNLLTHFFLSFLFIISQNRSRSFTLFLVRYIGVFFFVAVTSFRWTHVNAKKHWSFGGTRSSWDREEKTDQFRIKNWKEIWKHWKKKMKLYHLHGSGFWYFVIFGERLTSCYWKKWIFVTPLPISHTSHTLI